MTPTQQPGSTTELERRRTQMGRSIRGWGVIPGAVMEVADGHWAFLSGAPSPDDNIALVQSADRAALDRVLGLVEQLGAPALVMLTGDASEHAMPEGWQDVGTMPFMRADLAEVPANPDPRVRVAGPDDLDATVSLLSDAYRMEPAISRRAAEPVLTGATAEHGDMRFWLLVDDGTPVSTVLDARTEDVITLWCMATPERFGRRGYARALLGHVLHAARAEAITIGLLAASPAGKPLYDATGWRTLEEWRLFLRGTSVQFG
jgi:predicted GNAT family acetyltransferase